MLELLLNAALWFPASIVIGGAAAWVWVARQSRRGGSRRVTVLGALHVLHGCVMGIMGSGHIVAVTIKAAQGTLAEGVTFFLYPIGLALALPGWLLVAYAPRLRTRPESARRILAALDAWLVLVLVALGPSAVLGAPAFLNLLALWRANRALERTVLALSALFYLGMLIAALVSGGGDF